MADRVIVYPSSIPLADDILRTNKFAMTALGMALQAILGTGTIFDGLICTPTSPASMQVKLTPGSVYALENVDGTAYSDLGSDTTRQIVKQGIVLDNTLLSCPAPVTTGNSINYLIQAAYQDQDTDSVVLPYFDASNPSVAWAGPNNTGTSQNTTRKGALVLSVKAGTSATTGTQTTPSPDAGFTGLWVVTVANGATSIISGNITKAAGAPFINYKLPQLAPSGSSRTFLSGATQVNVSPSGNDSTGDGTSGNPWQTIQHAINVIQTTYDLNGFTVTIKLANGTYAPFIVNGQWVGPGFVKISGDTTTPSNCIIDSPSQTASVQIAYGAAIQIEGVKLTGVGFGLYATRGGRITITGKMDFGAFTTGGSSAHMIGEFGGIIENNGVAYTISGAADIHHYAANAGQLSFTGSIPVTITGTPNFSVAFANVYSSFFLSLGTTYTGSVTGVSYKVTLNGVIDTNSSTTFPGSAGSTATGGQIT